MEVVDIAGLSIPEVGCGPGITRDLNGLLAYEVSMALYPLQNSSLLN
jgi:hypothetical protein